VLDLATVLERGRLVSAPGLQGLPEPVRLNDRIELGETLEVSLWEAAPAALLGASGDANGSGVARALVLPGQMVGTDGTVSVPFIGRLPVRGLTPAQVEAAIVAGLQGKAHRPQALVRALSQVSQEATVVGEVKGSRRLPLTARGERLLDAIALAGGSTVPVDKATVRLSRGEVHREVALDRVIREPAQNVLLSAGDVVTVFFQPRHFMAMGAVAKPGEVAFEATGLSLAQALGRVGGVLDQRADASGVFIARREATGPVVYQLDLRRPESLFVMRDFALENEDIVYVANAPAVELQKFLGLLGSAIYPLDVLRNLSN
jgi:polysaccharide export outer membrane protein